MASPRSIALPVALLALSVSAVPAHAQRSGARGPAHLRPAQGRMTAPPFTPARGRGRRGERRGSNGLFFYPDYFSDDYEPYAEGTPEQPPVQQVVIQQPVQQAQQPPVKPIEPLVLEERDGQWMRVPIGSELKQANGAAGSHVQAPALGDERSSQPPVELPPVVLVFRDGHREEVGNYTIEGDALYTHADYWATGSWSRKILIADLDVPASLKLNAERGAKFSLPRGPNQVVIRF
ncbi:MAG TPA: hypothetical protein VKS44_12975 [Candidatus Acidoferrales bacterium]|nr:hypothetical protein [Candidatus Acidoferrales bacterium]